MEDHTDIYGDLPDIKPKVEFYEDTTDRWEELNAKYKKVLSENKKLKKENENLLKTIRNLRFNFHSLLATAKTEIKRKNRMIDELRR